MPIHYRAAGDHLLLITIDRPERKNAMDLHHFRDLAKAWRDFRDDDDLWVAIITGSEGCFMAGADLKDYVPQITALSQQIAAGEVDEIDGCKLSDGTEAVLRNMKLYKPIIAAVDGPCVAGGMEMLGGIDIRLATPRATFGVLEPKRGLFAGGGTLVTPGVTVTLTATGAHIDGDGLEQNVAKGATAHTIHVTGDVVCGTTIVS